VKRRGQHTPQREQALQEQTQAANVRATVDRVEYFLYLQKKFGPRKVTP
jgi:hypothetical protein